MGDPVTQADLLRCLWALLYLAIVLPLPVHPDDLDDPEDDAGTEEAAR